MPRFSNNDTIPPARTRVPWWEQQNFKNTPGRTRLDWWNLSEIRPIPGRVRSSTPQIGLPCNTCKK
jgi:hypothetical protein